VTAGKARGLPFLITPELPYLIFTLTNLPQIDIFTFNKNTNFIYFIHYIFWNQSFLENFFVCSNIFNLHYSYFFINYFPYSNIGGESDINH